MRLVPLKGMRCLDDFMSRQELRKQVRAHDTWLGAYFFAPVVFKEKFADRAYPTSFAEFLATAQDLRVTVQGHVMPRRTCVRFEASNAGRPHSFCFKQIEARWVLAALPNCG
jgi:hypothetical protein